MELPVFLGGSERPASILPIAINSSTHALQLLVAARLSPFVPNLKLVELVDARPTHLFLGIHEISFNHIQHNIHIKHRDMQQPPYIP